MLDGMKLYSHCRKGSSGAYLQSCWAAKSGPVGDTGDTKYYEEHTSGNCAASSGRLDKAGGYAFDADSGFVDSKGTALGAYAYVASETYPFVQPYFYGGTTACNVILGTIADNKFVPSDGSKKYC